ncbi:MAG: surface-adhesin E family protein [Pseudomonadota bacterium]
MKSKQILASLIFFLSSISVIVPMANAEDLVKEEVAPLSWKYLSTDAEKSTYILQDTPKNSGKDSVEAWTLWDYKLQQTGQADRKFMSMKQSSKFSCKSHTFQLVSVAMYSEKMGSGKLVAMANLKDQPWEKIAPHSARAVILTYLCENK